MPQTHFFYFLFSFLPLFCAFGRQRKLKTKNEQQLVFHLNYFTGIVHDSCEIIMEKCTTRYIPWVDQTPSRQYTFAEELHPFVELYQDECIKSLFYRLFSQQQQWLNQSKRQAASHIQAKVPANHLENEIKSMTSISQQLSQYRFQYKIC